MDEMNTNQQGSVKKPTYTIKTDEVIKKEHKHNMISVIVMLVIFAFVIITGLYVLNMVSMSKKAPASNDYVKPSVPAETTAPPQTIKTTTTVIDKTEIKSPETVVQDFYNWYKDFNGKITDADLNSREEIFTEFAEKAKQSQTDPFFCSDSKQDFDVESLSLSSDSAEIIVNLKDKTLTTALVSLVRYGTEWKIISSECLPSDNEISILENLKTEANLNYSTIKSGIFSWNLQDYKGIKTIQLSGYGISTANAAMDDSVIKNFFMKKGFKSDRYNEKSYVKNKIACIDGSSKDESGKFNIEIHCNKLAL